MLYNPIRPTFLAPEGGGGGGGGGTSTSRTPPLEGPVSTNIQLQITRVNPEISHWEFIWLYNLARYK